MDIIPCRCWVGNRMWFVTSMDFVNHEVRGLPFNMDEGRDEEILSIENLEYAIDRLDKNGNLLYVGDIITIGNKFTCEIVYYEGAFRTRCFGKARKVRESSYLDYRDGYSWELPGNLQGEGNPWELIGNIHENPEIIKLLENE